MFFRKRPRPRNRFRMEPGRRVYAIGDIHGRYDLLEEMLALVCADDSVRDDARTTIVFLGDLTDRGPQSREVVRMVRALCDEGVALLLKGNHEELFVDAVRGDRQAARALLSIGGDATLRSYGIGDEEMQAGSLADLTALLGARIPAEDIDFLDGAMPHLRLGDYLFVHAGIEPGIAIEEQQEREMRWVRGHFTRSARDHGVMVVHGHSVSDEVELRDNRIGIDTGAYASGRLSAIGIEGEEVWILEAREPADR